jgi:hypothetical protein
MENWLALVPSRLVADTFSVVFPVFDTWKVRSLNAFVSTVP